MMLLMFICDVIRFVFCARADDDDDDDVITGDDCVVVVVVVVAAVGIGGVRCDEDRSGDEGAWVRLSGGGAGEAEC